MENPIGFTQPRLFIVTYLPIQTKMGRGGGQVVYCSPSFPTIRVRIPLKLPISYGKNCLKKNDTIYKEAGDNHLKIHLLQKIKFETCQIDECHCQSQTCLKFHNQINPDQ